MADGHGGPTDLRIRGLPYGQNAPANARLANVQTNMGATPAPPGPTTPGVPRGRAPAPDPWRATERPAEAPGTTPQAPTVEQLLADLIAVASPRDRTILLRVLDPPAAPAGKAARKSPGRPARPGRGR